MMLRVKQMRWKTKNMIKNVRSVGGIFVPLVVEIFDVWMSNYLQILAITSKACSVRSITLAKVLDNLIQNLSIHLWAYNGQMIFTWMLAEGLEWNLPT